MTALSETVHELTRDHKRFITRDNGTREAVDEMSLLDQLEAAKTMKLNVDGPSGGGGAGLPLGAGPLDVQHEIIRTVHHTVSPHNRYELASLPLPVRIRRWAGLVDDDTALMWATTWASAIRDLFAQKIVIDRPCPMCGAEQIEQSIDGETEVTPALVVVVETKSCTCKKCLNTWEGLEELNTLSGSLT